MKYVTRINLILRRKICGNSFVRDLNAKQTCIVGDLTKIIPINVLPRPGIRKIFWILHNKYQGEFHL